MIKIEFAKEGDEHIECWLKTKSGKMLGIMENGKPEPFKIKATFDIISELFLCGEIRLNK